MSQIQPNFNLSTFKTDQKWLALAIGNSRLHWALFIGSQLQKTWDTNYFNPELVENFSRGEWQHIAIPDFACLSHLPPLPLYIASVVPTQTAIWQKYPHVKIITLDQIPLLEIYPTLGIDRALAVWGAGINFNWPILVIDAGTALTFTGVDPQKRLLGGAILPGLSLQLKTLANKTAALPEITLPTHLPDRWGLNTQNAIQSGIIYSILAGIRDFIEAWWDLFPDTPIALTGGDANILFEYLKLLFPQIAIKVIIAPNLIFWGMAYIINQEL